MKMKTHIQIYCVKIISQFCGEKQLGNQTEGQWFGVFSSRTPMRADIYPSLWGRICSCSNCTARGTEDPQMSASISQMVFPCSPQKLALQLSWFILEHKRFLSEGIDRNVSAMPRQVALLGYNPTGNHCPCTTCHELTLHLNSASFWQITW